MADFDWNKMHESLEATKGVGPVVDCELDWMLQEIALDNLEDTTGFDGEKTSTGSTQVEAGFISASAIGKTAGLSYPTEANS